MHTVSRRVFILKFGSQAVKPMRLEVRNESLELLGTTNADNLPEISRLMCLSRLSSTVIQQLQAAPHGKITLISL
ncbi:MAG: hypothetical protein IPN95_04610 [Bacteroidetes bacterium]|nr:hypothetical protein [Bacteroidota bacterium]MBL0015392.1 hypothetical protein [Bacteroidota bacterium]MBP6640787.1 hypothetical protein [Bacteroidia bacterium]MBP8074056.1 hypothetical protein [Bacteroidia bacterium]